jgi:hypothetical protein
MRSAKPPSARWRQPASVKVCSVMFPMPGL